MKKEILLQNQKINYTLRKSLRINRIRLSVNQEGLITVTVPFYVPESYAEKFIEEKSQWLLSKISFFKNSKNFSVRENRREEYLKYKEKTRELVQDRLKYFNSFYGFDFNRVSIKNLKSRWGSCSKKKNLNFSYKIYFLPKRLSDYIIVHELCHLKELNHSPSFWKLVSETIPDYKKLKNELKKSA